MLAPVCAIASTVLRDLSENNFGRETALGKMSNDSLLRPFRWHLGIEKHQHRRPRSAPRPARPILRSTPSTPAAADRVARGKAGVCGPPAPMKANPADPA